MIQRIAIAAMLLLLLVGCGNSSPVTPAPCACPAKGIPLSRTGGSEPLPQISTFTGTLTYPANNAANGTSLNVASTTSTGTPLPAGWNFLWQNNPLVWYLFDPSGTVTFSGPLQLAVNMGSNMPPLTKGPGFLEIDATGFDLTAQTQDFAGSALAQNINATTATFSLSAPTFTAGHTYQLVLTYAYPAP
jgi:hypothetical protein